MKYYVLIDDQEFEVEIDQEGRVTLNGEALEVELVRVTGQNLYSLLVNHRSYEIAAEEVRWGYNILLAGEQYEARVEDEHQRRLGVARLQPAPVSGITAVTAPIPGLIVKVEVKEGDSVTASQPVVILEAMKMENEIRAPRPGVVKAVHVAPGQSVDQGQVLVILD